MPLLVLYHGAHGCFVSSGLRLGFWAGKASFVRVVFGYYLATSIRIRLSICLSHKAAFAGILLRNIGHSIRNILVDR